ncbi:MAG TPA: FAD-dependent oxidoreductase [Syntrophomonadaceae bacterium]|nr:FAD-dependent oxidoreductase [Syntrophomonadaceae bacterium]
MQDYQELFSPAWIGKVMVKNRVVMAPMLVGYAHSSGEVSKRLVDYYEARARGGVGLIIVEAASVHPSGMESFAQLRIDSSRFVPGLERLSETIKAYGARIFLQLFHAGRQTSSTVTGEKLLAPSSIPCPMMGEEPREMTELEIEKMEESFASAASRAALAGFDGVELHAAHGYLINQFLSPHSNSRSDQYGGSLENRMRFLVNIVRRIKSMNPELLLSVRLNMDDFVPRGLQLEESILIARRLEEEGVNLIHCSSGTYESGLNSIEPASYQEGWRAYLAGELKKWVSIPVISGGVLNNPGAARQLIASGQADFVFLGRSLLADPEWVNKVKQGQTRDVRPCLLCNRCIESNFKGLAVRCTVNYWTGREAEFKADALEQMQGNVVIVGSGPAGLQAALSLKRLGLEVVVYEKEPRAGGLLNLAGRPPHKHRLTRYRDYLVREAENHNIAIILNHAFTADDLVKEAPDFVVAATGSEMKRPSIPGQERNYCLDLNQVLEESIPITNKRVIVIGGGSNGCEAADFLLARGNQVTVVEQAAFLAADMEKKNRRDMMNRMEKGGLIKKVGSQVLAIEDGWVSLKNRQGIERLEADYVVLATGYASRQDLFIELNQLHPRVFLIGDAFEVSGIRSAVAQAEVLARRISGMGRL